MKNQGTYDVVFAYISETNSDVVTSISTKIIEDTKEKIYAVNEGNNGRLANELKTFANKITQGAKLAIIVSCVALVIVYAI